VNRRLYARAAWLGLKLAILLLLADAGRALVIYQAY
jgi:hypothetical protein